MVFGFVIYDPYITNPKTTPKIIFDLKIPTKKINNFLANNPKSIKIEKKIIPDIFIHLTILHLLVY